MYFTVFGRWIAIFISCADFVCRRFSINSYVGSTQTFEKVPCQFIYKSPEKWVSLVITDGNVAEYCWTMHNAYTKLGPNEYHFSNLKLSFHFKRRVRFAWTMQPHDLWAVLMWNSQQSLSSKCVMNLTSSLCFISLLLFISSGCNFRLHLVKFFWTCFCSVIRTI